MLKKALLLSSVAVSLFASMSAFSLDRLMPNQYITSGQRLDSARGCFHLDMQSDGNLVIYRSSNGQAIWSSKTQNTGTYFAVMQADGNFVTYNYAGKPTWNSRTNNHEGSWVVLQDDGNLVVYAYNSLRPLWSSGTVTHC
ncbi:lectin [Silvanigrella paludirubra]|uniref:Lectin n=1 Tax=Silvanigrella paludirubra TaxID=2499159 RepID=A0A6N6VTA8_9BACT|nr:lectin [Silvanigrella paludirubra]KAB8038786.1 lectin [Silvanigrella paludirubra]